MTRRRWAWRAEAAVVRAALALLRRLGPVGASDLGGLVARSLGPLLPVSCVAHANLRRVMPELDAAARSRIVRDVWDNLGRTVGELPHLGSLRPTVSGPGWVLEGAEIVRAVAAAGGPAILVSGHLGNWEVLPRVCAHEGLLLANFYRAPANPEMNALLRQLRDRALGVPSSSFAKGSAGARAALAHLRNQGFLGMLVDQKMNDGVQARLFGQPAMTAPAAATFALRFGCPVIPGYVERVGPARFRLVCEPPLPLPASGDRSLDIAALTQTINDRLEAWIRARPGQWLWLHRRWPTLPDESPVAPPDGSASAS